MPTMTDKKRHCFRCGDEHEPPEARCERYNGWTNYETWCVNLWLTNEPGTSEELSRVSAEKREAYQRADQLKEWVSADLMPDLGATLEADLLSGALSEVDWQEIIENHEADND